VEDILLYPSQFMKAFVQTVFEHPLTFPNFDGHSILAPSQYNSTVTMYYREIILQQIYDYNYLQTNNNFSNILNDSVTS
jgi:hypothetical protein